MRIIETTLPDVKIIVPPLYYDARGFFMESYHAEKFAALVGKNYSFVQDNHSQSIRHVLRGLHYQLGRPQGKLVRVVSGEIFDVAVDMRRSSPTYGQAVTSRLSSENHYQMWIPPHFAHGFLVLSKRADVIYKTTDFYDPAEERSLCWNDPDLSIAWPLSGLPLLSLKDQHGSLFKDAESFV